MRIVIKIGTQSLLSADNTLNLDMVRSLIKQIAALKESGHAIILISSGAVGAGRGLWRKHHKKTHFSDPVLGKQVLSSLGQANLIHHYNKVLEPHGMVAAQLLMTRHDFRQRKHFVNVARLLEELLTRKTVLPIVNENDSLAVKELMFTDNDQLSALVAAQINADKLIMLTNVDGVYDPETKEPIRKLNPDERWPVIGAEKSVGGRGGMSGKLDAARKMARAGITVHIARAQDPDILHCLMASKNCGTTILPTKKPKSKKRWLAVHTETPRGRIIINDCLIERHKTSDKALSILPVGITEISGTFEKNDIVEITDDKGKRLGYGQARYNAKTLKTHLGKQKKPTFIHYDALHWEI